MIIELTSPFDVNSTTERIVAAAEQMQWKVPAVHDLQQTLAKSGKIVMPVRVIELCKPELAGQILEKNQERAISVFMPCRISVFEREDGKTYIGIMNVQAMAPMMPETITGPMLAAAEGTEHIIKTALSA